MYACNNQVSVIFNIYQLRHFTLLQPFVQWISPVILLIDTVLCKSIGFRKFLREKITKKLPYHVIGNLEGVYKSTNLIILRINP